MTTAAEFLGAVPGEDGSWRFSLGPDIHGAFGGVFGGAVAAAAVMAARPAAPGRRPFSTHVTFVRSLSSPTCHASVEVVNEGRTITTAVTELFDEGDRLAARATTTFADESALHPLDDRGAVEPPEFDAWEAGRSLGMVGGVEPPIVQQLGPRLVGRPSGGYAHAVRLPWLDAGATAEAACMAADFCVGVPVGAAMRDEWVPIPNPDLSLRFVGDEAGEELVGVGRLAGIERGVAGTQVEVWSPAGADDGSARPRLVAIGLSSAVLLGGRR